MKSRVKREQDRVWIEAVQGFAPGEYACILYTSYCYKCPLANTRA